MVAYDVIMLVVIVAISFRGWQKGMAWQIASLCSIVLSWFVCVQFRAPVADMIPWDPPLNRFAAMAALFLGTSLVVWMMFQSVKKSIERWKLRDFDRQMGALVGVAKGIAIASLMTLAGATLLGDDLRETILGSKSGAMLSELIQRTHGIMPEEIQTVFAPYLDNLDEDQGPAFPGAVSPGFPNTGFPNTGFPNTGPPETGFPGGDFSGQPTPENPPSTAPLDPIYRPPTRWQGQSNDDGSWR